MDTESSSWGEGGGAIVHRWREIGTMDILKPWLPKWWIPSFDGQRSTESLIAKRALMYRFRSKSGSKKHLNRTSEFLPDPNLRFHIRPIDILIIGRLLFKKGHYLIVLSTVCVPDPWRRWCSPISCLKCNGLRKQCHVFLWEVARQSKWKQRWLC